MSDVSIINNLSNLSVDANGRVRFSGLSSGIDVEGVVNSIISAKRIPVDRLEANIVSNTAKIAAMNQLQSLMQSYRESLKDLRGAISFDSSSDIFKAKSAFASSSRTDSQTPTAAASMMGITVANTASTGSHTVEITQLAKAHKVRSQSFSSLATGLGLAGSFSIVNADGDSKAITVTAGDTLADVRSRINNANSGTDATGVTASILSVSSSEHYLVLTKDDTGEDLLLSEEGTVLAGLGLSTNHGTSTYRTGSATSKVAMADGFLRIASDGTQGDAAFAISYDNATRTITLRRGDGATDTAILSSNVLSPGATETVAFSTFGMSITIDDSFDKGSDLTLDADSSSVTGGTGAITDSTIVISGVTNDMSAISSKSLTFSDLGTPAAITVTVGGFSGTFDGTSTGAKTVTLSDGSGNALEVSFTVATVFDGTESAASITLNELDNLVGSSGDAAFTTQMQAAQNALINVDGFTGVSRSSNTITDVLQGVTLSLFQAEVGTTITMDIERNLTAVKEAITGFASAYNDVKVFLNQQTAFDPATGAAVADNPDTTDVDESAQLVGNRTAADIERRLAAVFGGGAVGLTGSGALSVLAQIGLTFVDNDDVADPLQVDTLELNEATLDEKLLADPDGVRRLFAFDFSSSDPRISLLSWTSATTPQSGGYVLNLGGVGPSQHTGAAVENSTALLNDSVNGAGATTSGSFSVNGNAIAYDVTTDTLTTLAQAINDAAISGVTASVVADSNGDFQLRVLGSVPVTVDGDTGDLLASMPFAASRYIPSQANIGGAADGSDNGTVTISGQTLTITSSSGGEGLKVFFQGVSDLSGVALNFSTGIGTLSYDEVNSMLDEATGILDTAVDGLQDENTNAQTRIDEMLIRIEQQRQVLTNKFLAMEQAISSATNLLEQLTSMTNSLTQNR
ncbi:MAG: flagellar filament capping protein FliD [Alphaproteobacteria bacterium]